MLDGNPLGVVPPKWLAMDDAHTPSLGHFAVKKIAVGQSHSYLLNILREVRTGRNIPYMRLL